MLSSSSGARLVVLADRCAPLLTFAKRDTHLDEILQLSGFLTTLKGLPATYNKDLQESQEPMFDAADTVGKSMRILAGVISTLTVRTHLGCQRADVLMLLLLQIFPEKMAKSLTPDMLATDLAEYLVRKGVRPRTSRIPRYPSLTLILLAQIPFRETHHISGSCIRLSEDNKVPLSDLTLAQFQSVCPTFSEDVKDVFNFETSVERRDAAGGTSRHAVMVQIASLKNLLTMV
jgi:argininosuccinate lyase